MNLSETPSKVMLRSVISEGRIEVNMSAMVIIIQARNEIGISTKSHSRSRFIGSLATILTKIPIVATIHAAKPRRMYAVRLDQ